MTVAISVDDLLDMAPLHEAEPGDEWAEIAVALAGLRGNKTAADLRAAIAPLALHSPTSVLMLTAVAAGVTVSDITSRGQSARVARARACAAYLMRHDLNYSFKQIGRKLGRDHTTVMSACDRIDRELSYNDPETTAIVRRVRSAMQR